MPFPRHPGAYSVPVLLCLPCPPLPLLGLHPGSIPGTAAMAGLNEWMWMGMPAFAHPEAGICASPFWPQG